MQTPEAIAALPKDQRGYPIPFFVYRPEDGAEPDLRIADVRTKRLCHRKRLCWVCGRKLGETIAFIGGPKSVQQHVFADYALHLLRANVPTSTSGTTPERPKPLPLKAPGTRTFQ